MTKINNIKKFKKRDPSTGRRALDQLNQIIMDNIPVSIITINKKGYITSVNKYFLQHSKIINYRQHNIFKDKFFLQDNLGKDYKRMLTNGEVVIREHFYEKDGGGKGRDKYFKIIAVPLRDMQGNIIGAISMILDNTEASFLKNELLKLNNSLEEKVKQRTDDLNKLNIKLIQTMELKDIFLADVSHEFRTSLTIMHCSLELLAKVCGNSPENNELLGNLITETKRVTTMLNDLSHITQSNIPNLPLPLKKIQLDPLIKSVCRELQLVADGKNIKIYYSHSPVSIYAKKEDIEKLLLNLIRNAIKYNKNEGWVKVSTEKIKTGVLLRVEDNGIGIAESDLINVFERFFRVDKSRNRNGVDSGLGLAICKHIAEYYGGNITVTSKLGQGSIFTVFFPAKFKNK